jgi:alkylation response protein AidB-like acyl-CoA dehydrogenase
VNLEPTVEQQALVTVIRELARDHIRPAARTCEEAGRPSDEVEEHLRQTGVAAPVPEEFGGQGTFDAVTSVMIAEEVAYGDPGVAFCVLGGGLAATVIDLVGSPGQRAALLPQLAAGAQGALLLAERDAGADVSLVEAEARRHGDGRLLTGTKYGVVGADGHGPRIVVARSEGSLGLWLVAPSTDLMPQPEDKLGLRSARTFKVMLDGTPATECLGGEEADPARVMLALLRAKLLDAGVALGLARAALEYATAYAKERTAFGKPIGSFQGIAFKIADRAMDVEAARLLTWKAAWAVDEGRSDADRAVMAACGQAVATAVTTADDAVQVLGGHGYMRDHPVELWYRDALTLATFDSPSMIGDLFLARAFEASGAGGALR